MFSQASEYALRALTELARFGPGEWVLAHDLAKHLDIPVHYLAKILQVLARRGILESQRGRLGGFRLARLAGEIHAWDVVVELDDTRRVESCVMGQDECSDEDPCPLHNLWKSMRQQFMTELQGTTLEDLAAFDRSVAASEKAACGSSSCLHDARERKSAGKKSGKRKPVRKRRGKDSSKRSQS